MDNVIPTGQKPRKLTAFDASLVLRSQDAAAITTAGANFASPDYESGALDLGKGQTVSKVVIHNITATLNSDNGVHFVVKGIDTTDSNVEAVLGSLFVGKSVVTGENAKFDLVTGSKDVEIYFNTALRERTFDKVKLAVVNVGTAAGFSLDFEAFISRIA